MSQISSLVNYIHAKQQATYDEVEREAMRINIKWRESSWTRSLRKRSDIKAIGKDGGEPNGENPIVLYKSMKIKAEQPKYNLSTRLFTINLNAYGKHEYKIL